MARRSGRLRSPATARLGRKVISLALDTNILIYAIEGNTNLGQAAVKLLQAPIAQLKRTISASTITEILSNPKLNNEEADDLYQTILQLDCRFIPLSQEVLLETAKIRRQLRIATPDAIHLACAKIAQVDYFVSNDLILLRQSIPTVKSINLESAIKLLD